MKKRKKEMDRKQGRRKKKGRDMNKVRKKRRTGCLGKGEWQVNTMKEKEKGEDERILNNRKRPQEDKM